MCRRAHHPWKKQGPALGDGCGNLAYDPSHHQLVLLTRQGMWKWKGGKKWKPLAPATMPPIRCGASLAWDGHHLILFGGYSEEPLGPRNDTWEWTGKTWVELHPLASPPPGAWGAMAQTPAGLVLYVGNDAGGVPSGETWTWDGATWSDAGASGPPARGAAGIASDGQRVMLFGGGTSVGGVDTFFGDTWVWE